MTQKTTRSTAAEPSTSISSGPTHAEAVFRSLCQQQGGTLCPRCATPRHYELRDGRLRCASCAHTFHRFSGRWIKRSGIGPQDWLKLIQLFQRGLTVSQVGAVLERSYNTVHKAFMILRTAILAHCPTTAALLDDTGAIREFCTAPKPESDQEFCLECRSPVFAIRSTGRTNAGDENVEVRLMESLRAREVLATPLARNMFQTFIYTDRFQEFDALLFSCCKTVRRAHRNGTGDGYGPVSLDHSSAFWAFARPWLTQYRSIAPGTYPLYIKEIEYRFNHRSQAESWSTTMNLAAMLCAPIAGPDAEPDD